MYDGNKTRCSSFDVDNSKASLTGFRKKLYKAGKRTIQKLFDIMGFNTINIHCKVASGVSDNSNDTDKLYF